MIRKKSALKVEKREAVRGGVGKALAADYLVDGQMEGVVTASRIVLEPGASVGEHTHADTEEFYLILEGRGTGILDGERFPVGPGDAYLLKVGHTHGLVNDSEGPLAFFAFITRQTTKG
jgi:mannose-6-phosphate isomerase-like protein (cupin superfamily)